jgi:sporulation protein YhbH
MAVTRSAAVPADRGGRDAQHNRERVRKQIEGHLRKNIGDQDIIADGDSARVRVPIKGNKRYQFVTDRGKTKGVGQGDGDVGTVLGPPLSGRSPGHDAGHEPGEELYEVWLDMAEVEEYLFSSLELPRLKPKKEVEVDSSAYKFDDIARKGPQLDKKTTLRQNMIRNAASGQGVRLGDIDREDLRYLSYRDKPQPKSKAVAFLMADVSASMGSHEKQITRLFYYWIIQFLRFKYDQVDVVFIAHHATAQEVSETEFFSRTESGGTMVSSAYRLCQEIQRDRFPVDEYNIYVLHASDGDNWALDNEEVFASITELCKIAALVGYLEIHNPGWGAWGMSWEKLGDSLADKRGDLGEEFKLAEVAQDADIWPAIQRFFAKDNVDEAVR